MPRTQLQAHVRELKRPQINVVRMFFKSNMDALELTSAELAERTHEQPGTLRARLNRPEGSWTLQQLDEMSAALNLPPGDVYALLAERRRKA